MFGFFLACHRLSPLRGHAVVRIPQFIHNSGNFRTVGKRMADSNGETGQRSSLHGHWSSRIAFILAVTGSAVGLGNIWKFPYAAGENGGGAFVIIYLLCVFGIGLPVMMAEILLGRRGRRNPVATMEILGTEEAGQPRWRYVGLMGVMAGFVILSYYSVVAGWTLAYIPKAISGAFAGADKESAGALFGGLIANPLVTGAWHTIFMATSVGVVARGVEEGLEVAVRFMVPALVILLLVLLGYAMTAGDFSAGLEFLFMPDWEKVDGSVVLAAMGQAFFTLSVGMGAVMAYGAYLPNESSISQTALAVVCADTAIAILAGLVIFPLVFANGLDAAGGPGLVFVTLPLAFGQMAGGAFFGTLFFILLAFAALTSAVSLLEPAVAWVVESFNVSRATAAIRVGGIIWLLGFASVFSFGPLADFKFLNGTFFDNFEFLAEKIMLPLGGFCIVVFAGWVMCQNSSADELDPHAGPYYRIWRFLARVVAPVGVILVLLSSVGLLDSLFAQ
jgi:NSS family neurotransmitter:Na+ symporter